MRRKLCPWSIDGDREPGIDPCEWESDPDVTCLECLQWDMSPYPDGHLPAAPPDPIWVEA
jgi:hypothetical protein